MWVSFIQLYRQLKNMKHMLAMLFAKCFDFLSVMQQTSTVAHPMIFNLYLSNAAVITYVHCSANIKYFEAIGFSWQFSACCFFFSCQKFWFSNCLILHRLCHSMLSTIAFIWKTIQFSCILIRKTKIVYSRTFSSNMESLEQEVIYNG